MYQIDQVADRHALAAFCRDRLLNNVLPFWFPRCLDRKHGGFLHSLDADGTVVDTDKSVWAHGRMAWMLATLFNTLEPREEWKEWARSGIGFLNDHAFDEDGRMFFHLTREGRPIRKRRYAFSESFASIAWGAWAKATEDPQAHGFAIDLFERFVDWNLEPERVPPKFTDVRPTTSIGPRMIAIATAQSLRNDLGIGDAFDPRIERWIREIIELFLKRDHRAVMETVAPDGSIVDSFDGRILNPGHAIEAAWFILDEVHHLQLPPGHDWVKAACDMIHFSLERGWDSEFGGLFYFRDVYGRPVQEYWHAMKFWWPHNEALIALLMAFDLSHEQEFVEWFSRIFRWSFEHFEDPDHGEWFGYLHRDGSPSSTLKGNLWKSCFHYPRMLWKIHRWLESAP